MLILPQGEFIYSIKVKLYLQGGVNIAYILLALILWFLIMIIARKDKIRQYLPALLYAGFSSFALDVYFALEIRAYVYTSFLGQPLTSIITGIFLSPGFAVLFVHFLPTEKTLTTYYTLAWVGLLTMTDYTFIRIGALTFNTWNLGYSALAYLTSLSIIVFLVNLYREESNYHHSNF